MVNVRKLIVVQKKFYKNIGTVFCPVLNETIYFNSNGFRHLIFKNNREWRNVPEVTLKLSCLPAVPYVIKKAKEISQTRTIEVVKYGNKKVVRHFELVAKSKGKLIRVVLEKIGDGKIHFLSTMPHYKLSKKPRRG
ncbi:hypothetical protein KBC75_06375 [Candidatus Shapirobacteria bacterium]|nr:hypothetical protein [Candidatus Shapirobacteria bacterium]